MIKLVRCGECEFYENKMCKRNPPEVIVSGSRAANVRPMMSEGDGCGQGLVKLKTEK